MLSPNQLYRTPSPPLLQLVVAGHAAQSAQPLLPAAPAPPPPPADPQEACQALPPELTSPVVIEEALHPEVQSRLAPPPEPPCVALPPAPDPLPPP